MENLYKELRSFFANDIDLTDLFDSEAIIWIDWREYDEDVVNYFNDMMDEPIDIQTVSNGKPYGDDIFWGHCIIANIDADGNPVSADIAG